MIDADAAGRIATWVAEAVEAGAALHCGGGRDGVMVPATVLSDAPEDSKAMAEEIFGPVVCVNAYDDFGDALRKVNASDFGLQAGVFTRDLHRMYRAWDELEVGGVIVGEVPSWRVDHMPYGGVKDSGLGREGIRDAIDGMTEKRLLVVRA